MKKIRSLYRKRKLHFNEVHRWHVYRSQGMFKVWLKRGRMPNIYNYTDYRQFLEDFYVEQKERKKAFSYQYFANKAGFKSKSFLKLVIVGRKKLTSASMQKLNNVLNLNEKAFSYFKHLVAFNQAATLQERNYFFDKISQFNKRNSDRKVMHQEYEIYSRWYCNALRELVTTVDFKEDYALLGKMLRPSVSAGKVREAVRLLEKLGFIEKKPTGYVQCNPIITTGDEVRSLAVTNFHLENLKLCADSIENVSGRERDVSCLVMGLSEEGFDRVKSEIQHFRKKLLDIAAAEKTMRRVYHVSFQAIPVSEYVGDTNE